MKHQQLLTFPAGADAPAGAGAHDAGEPVAPRDAAAPRLPWIVTGTDLPYFLTDTGESWTPVGQNDGITWPDLAGLFRRRDLAGVEAYLRRLKEHGVTCLRLMLEYCHGEHRYIERPAGHFPPNMVRLWDDLFALVEQVGLHVLLTPVDTFFMWKRWRHHPYNRRNGGPIASRRRWLTDPAARDAIRARLAFASRRWGGSPALFGWDLWNEIHPNHGADDVAAVAPFIDDLAGWLRAFEIAEHGRAHLQTVSVFGPALLDHPAVAEPIFRHPRLDFANTHLYESGTIDDPKDTVTPARAVGRLMRAAVIEAGLRPVFDSEHGPIHRFLDRRKTLGEPLDDEYFRHIQWAHLASGGAGGGMRWPNRHPHSLTMGMRRAQRAMARALPLIDWTRFRRHNLTEELGVSDATVARFACGDDGQALVWLLRGDITGRDGLLARDRPPLAVRLEVPGLADGRYRATRINTVSGEVVGCEDATAADGRLMLPAVPVVTDVAIAIRAAG